MYVSHSYCIFTAVAAAQVCFCSIVPGFCLKELLLFGTCCTHGIGKMAKDQGTINLMASNLMQSTQLPLCFIANMGHMTKPVICGTKKYITPNKRYYMLHDNDQVCRRVIGNNNTIYCNYSKIQMAWILGYLEYIPELLY